MLILGIETSCDETGVALYDTRVGLLGEAEIAAIVAEAVAAAGAKSPADMGKVMGIVKPKLAGKADMGKVSALVKARLAG